MGVSVVIRGEGDMKRSVYDPNKDGEIALTALDSMLQKYIEFRTWNLSYFEFLTACYVGSQEPTPQSVFFKPDGTKMYIVGNSNDNVYEYDLSTAWDISTASYSQNFAVGSQDGEPRGVCFKPDGSKMYVIGAANDNVYEYDLSTAWDISTASYSQNFAVGSQDGESRGVFLKPDGSKMYVIGSQNDKVYEYVTNIDGDMKRVVYDSDKDEVIADSNTEVKTNMGLSAGLNAEKTVTGTTATKVFEFVAGVSKKVYFEWESKMDTAAGYVKLYVNGSEVENMVYESASSYTAHSFTSTNAVSSGDLVQVYLVNTDAGGTTYIQKIKAYMEMEV